jgi:hypothetical protein
VKKPPNSLNLKNQANTLKPNSARRTLRNSKRIFKTKKPTTCLPSTKEKEGKWKKAWKRNSFNLTHSGPTKSNNLTVKAKSLWHKWSPGMKLKRRRKEPNLNNRFQTR